MKFLVFDTETTGIPRHPEAKDAVQPQVIEYGGVLVDERGETLDEVSLLIDPGVRLPPEITKITGITDDDLIGQPGFGDALTAIREQFAAADAMVAHNLPFDYTMLSLELLRLGRPSFDEFPWPRVGICTVQEHFDLYGRRPRLIELYELAHNGEKFPQQHRALDDVHALVSTAKNMGVFDVYSSVAMSQ